MSSKNTHDLQGSNDVGIFVSSLAQTMGNKPVEMAFHAYSLMLIQWQKVNTPMEKPLQMALHAYSLMLIHGQKVEAPMDWDVVSKGLFLADGWQKHDAAMLNKITEQACLLYPDFVVPKCTNPTLENTVPEAKLAEKWKRHDLAMLSMMIFSAPAQNTIMNEERVNKRRARNQQSQGLPKDMTTMQVHDMSASYNEDTYFETDELSYSV